MSSEKSMSYIMRQHGLQISKSSFFSKSIVNMYFAKTYYVPLEFEVISLSDPKEDTVSIGGVFSISKSPEKFSGSQHEQFKA